MLSKNISEALNEHLNWELYSSYLYLSMAAYFDSHDLPGFAHWMKIQAREEMDHVVRVYEYIQERNGRVLLRGIQTPPTEWSSHLVAFEDALRHEEETTERVNTLVDRSLKEVDHATNNFVQWFVAEQVEEESSLSRVLQSVRMVEGAPGGLYMIDQNLGSRTYRSELTNA